MFPEELLSALSPPAAMAFLMAFASIWVILQVAKEDAKYSDRVRRILLYVSWPLFGISVIAMIVLLFIALLPIVETYAGEIPSVRIDPSVFILVGIELVMLTVFYFVFRFLYVRVEHLLPKSRRA